MSVALETYADLRDAGHRRIRNAFAEFSVMVERAEQEFAQGRLESAAIQAGLAASHIQNNGGLYSSPRVERLLIAIGQRTISPHSRPRTNEVSESRSPRSILHVASSVAPVGGHSRMIWRWIRSDRERSHSVALTRQLAAVPSGLIEAVRHAGGNIYELNRTVGSVIAWARRLREISTAYDLVVLHIHPHDVVPLIAFAIKVHCPPVCFVNHADHCFWLGASISDIVINHRESGIRFSHSRRRIKPARNVLLPIVVEPPCRTLSRSDAKRQLGLSKDCIMLLSIARAPKYRDFGDLSFLDTHIPVLQQDKRMVLVIVGAGERPDWSRAILNMGGRIIVHNETADTRIFLQAADIYVDSFPFVSNTSLLEAGTYGIPLVTYSPFPASYEILGADTPGFAATLVRARSQNAYVDALLRLASDEQYRLKLGSLTRQNILQAHSGADWLSRLEGIYERAMVIDRIGHEPVEDTPAFGLEDALIPFIFGFEHSVDTLIWSQLRAMPLSDRLVHWHRLQQRERPGNMGYADMLIRLLPEWFLCRSRFLWNNTFAATLVGLIRSAGSEPHAYR